MAEIAVSGQEFNDSAAPTAVGFLGRGTHGLRCGLNSAAPPALGWVEDYEREWDLKGLRPEGLSYRKEGREAKSAGMKARAAVGGRRLAGPATTSGKQGTRLMVGTYIRSWGADAVTELGKSLRPEGLNFRKEGRSRE